MNAERDAVRIEKEDMVANLELRVRLVEGTMSVATGRGHGVVIDRPLDRGGTDAGFLGGELLLAGEGGCFLSTLAAAAQSRGIVLRRAAVTVRAVAAAEPPRFAAVTVEVDLEADADAPTVAKLVQLAERGCIASNTLRGGTALTVVRRDAGAAEP
jgi:putative redox protein